MDAQVLVPGDKGLLLRIEVEDVGVILNAVKRNDTQHLSHVFRCRVQVRRERELQVGDDLELPSPPQVFGKGELSHLSS